MGLQMNNTDEEDVNDKAMNVLDSESEGEEDDDVCAEEEPQVREETITTKNGGSTMTEIKQTQLHSQCSKSFVSQVGHRAARQFLKHHVVFPNPKHFTFDKTCKHNFPSVLQNALPKVNAFKTGAAFSDFYSARNGKWLRFINMTRTGTVSKCRDRYEGKLQKVF